MKPKINLILSAALILNAALIVGCSDKNSSPAPKTEVVSMVGTNQIAGMYTYNNPDAPRSCGITLRADYTGELLWMGRSTAGKWKAIRANKIELDDVDGKPLEIEVRPNSLKPLNLDVYPNGSLGLFIGGGDIIFEKR